MAKKVLFVIEGEETERNLIVKPFQRVMHLASEDVEIVEYSTVIYDLYDVLQSEEYDSLIDYLWVNHRKIFSGDFIKPRDCFSAIYLVFDFDPQDHRFSIQKCKWLIRHFSDETEDGKLYFNYPMVESLIDIPSLGQKAFNNRTVSTSGLTSRNYKQRVKRLSCISQKHHQYSLNNGPFLRSLIYLHLNKYVFLVGRPKEEVIDSKLLLDSELTYFKEGKISVINSSILLLCDYNISLVDQLISEGKKD